MLTIDFADPATNADPFPIFTRLRESDPVHWSEPMKVWVVTRYEDVKAIALNNTEVSANRLAPFFAAVPESRRTGYASLIAYLSTWMVFRDPPDHTRLRRLFTKAWINSAFDFNRDGRVNAIDLALCRINQRHALALFLAPAAPTVTTTPEAGAPRGFAPTARGG